jgi:hypothetical protein
MEPYRETITATRPTVKPFWVMVLTMFGKKVALDGVYGREARVEDRVLGIKVFKAMQAYFDLGGGLVDTHPIKLGAGGRAAVVKSVDEFKTKPLSGQKLVCVV